MARIGRRASQRNVASTSDPSAHITEITYTAVPDGMFPGVPVHEIPDTGARYIKDAFVHNPGLITRRGPITSVPGIDPLTYPACGMVSVVDPTGTTRVGVLHGDATHGYLGVYSADFSSRTDVPLGVNLSTSPYRVVQFAPRLNGGVFLSILDKFTQGASQNLLLWKGAANPAYTTGTITITRGSTNLVGTGTLWRANTSAGMFVFAAGVYIGTVKTVNNDGSITLEKNALATATGSAYSIQPFRGINPRVGKGFVTTSTANATVNGANTKFQADGLGTGTWDIFRSSDMTFIGTVTSVVSDIQLTMTANATLNLDQEPYVAIRRDGSYANDPVGIGAIPSIWAGRQAYANDGLDMESTSRIWFSSVDDAEAIDEAHTDGDFIQVPSVGPAGVATPIVAMAPTPASMLILKENESYALFGQTTSQFAINPVSTDGCLSPMSVQSWNGIVIYAGRQGIYMYDGQQAINVTEQNLGWYYQSCVKGFDSSKHRMWSMIDRDHYFVFIEDVTPPIPVLKGTVSYPQTAFTIAIHLPTQAVTVLENVDIRGAAQLPSNLVKGTWFLVNSEQPDSHGTWADAADAQTGLQAASAVNSTVTLSGAVALHDVIVVAVSHGDASPAPDGVPTDNLGNTYTLVAQDYDVAHTQGLSVYTCIVAHPGVPTINAGFFGARSKRVMQVSAFRNTNATTSGTPPVLDAVFVTSGGASSAAGATLTAVPTAGSDLGVAIFCDTSGNGTWSGGPDQSPVGWINSNFMGVGAGVEMLMEFTYPSGVPAGTPVVAEYNNTLSDNYVGALLLFRTTGAAAGVQGVVCSADTLFDSGGNDSFACVGSVVGPDFYMETKKYTIGDPLLKKLWKMMLMTYVCVGDSIRLDTVPGFNEIGTQAKTAFLPSGLTWQDLQNQGLLWQDMATSYPIWDAPVMSKFVTKRIKFLKRSQAMSFRLYQNSPAVTALVLGPWSVVIKPQRVGRV